MASSSFSRNALSQSSRRNPMLVLIIVLFFIFLIIIIPFSYTINQQRRAAADKQITARPLTNVYVSGGGHTDPMRDPYAPPQNSAVAGVPVNVRTQGGSQQQYTQVGILTQTTTNVAGADGQLILPLMGRLNIRNRNRWQYYTMANGVGNINAKLPIQVSGKSCSADGCEELYTGDVVQVQGYNSSFTVTMYESQTIEYIPYI